MRKPKLKTLKIKADKAMSDYVRVRDNWTCSTCGKKGDKHNMQNGHFITRSAIATRYIESNCACQCSVCNVLKGGEKDILRRWLVNKFGIDEIERIEQERFKEHKMTTTDYGMLIEYYQGKLIELTGQSPK